MPMTLRFGWAETRSEIQAQSWRLGPCSSFFLHLSVLSAIPHCLALEGYPISNFRHLLQSKSRQTSESKEREGFQTVICDLFLGVNTASAVMDGTIAATKGGRRGEYCFVVSGA